MVERATPPQAKDLRWQPLLYRLGRTAFRRRKATLAVWLVLLGGMFAAAATLSGPTTDAATMPGTESQRAIDLLEQRLPEANGASGRIVFAAPEGERLTAGERATAVADAAAAAAKAPGVASVSEPLTSEDGRVALAQVNWADAGGRAPRGLGRGRPGRRRDRTRRRRAGRVRR